MEQQEYQNVAQTIIAQMGGVGRLTAMISAGNFAAGFHPQLKMPFLTFSFALTQPFAKDGVNRVFVYLTPSDEYRVDFFKEVTGQPLPESPVHTFDGMYADQLIELFESTTELYLTL